MAVKITFTIPDESFEAFFTLMMTSSDSIALQIEAITEAIKKYDSATLSEEQKSELEKLSEYNDQLKKQKHIIDLILNRENQQSNIITPCQPNSSKIIT